MNKTMGEYATFWFYMCWCIAGLFFVYFFLPETKGKSLEEIERMFANKKKQQLYTTGLNGAEVAFDKSSEPVTIFTVEPIPRVPEKLEDKKFHQAVNGAYEYDSDDEDNDEVVATPL